MIIIYFFKYRIDNIELIIRKNLGGMKNED